MRCLECGKKIDDNENVCPFCGALIGGNSDTEIIELPNLKSGKKVENNIEKKENDLEKTKEFVFDLEKTKSISSIEETKELSLVDDINKQINDMNNEAEDENSYEEIDGVVSNEAIDLSSNDSVKKRRKILLIAGICTALLVTTIITVFVFLKRDDNNASSNYIELLESALQNYYDSNEIDDVIYVLESVKNDETRLTNVQARTKEIGEEWIQLYLEMDITTTDDFETISSRYRELINGLYNYAVVTNKKDEVISVLTDEAYEELIESINNIYDDSTTFFDALSYYNEKDYDKAYYMFGLINKNNSYYDKAQTYMTTIINKIMDSINSDIKKIESGIDELDDYGKLQRYTQIEEVINQYANLYTNINLNKVSEYKELLNVYTNKVTEYTEKVSSSESEQSENSTESEDVTNEQTSSEENLVEENNEGSTE